MSFCCSSCNFWDESTFHLPLAINTVSVEMASSIEGILGNILLVEKPQHCSHSQSQRKIKRGKQNPWVYVKLFDQCIFDFYLISNSHVDNKNICDTQCTQELIKLLDHSISCQKIGQCYITSSYSTQNCVINSLYVYLQSLPMYIKKNSMCLYPNISKVQVFDFDLHQSVLQVSMYPCIQIWLCQAI